MIARRILLLTGLLTLAFASPHAIALPPAPGERIVAGVTAAGVDVSGLTVDPGGGHTGDDALAGSGW